LKSWPKKDGIEMYNDIDQTIVQWMTSKRFTEDPRINALIRQRVEEYLEAGGYVFVSHFERAYLELLNEGAIQPFRGSIAEQPAPAPLIPKEIIDFIESPRVSVFEQRRRYATDPAFKKYYDLYLNQVLKAKVASEETELAITVEQYNAMPRTEIVKKYRSSPSFKRGVDSLIKRGLI
jgi:hypothetical protein